MITLHSVRYHSKFPSHCAKGDADALHEHVVRRFCIVVEVIDNSVGGANGFWDVVADDKSWTPEEREKIVAWCDGFMASASLWER